MNCRIAHITDLHWRQHIQGSSGDHNRQSRLVPFAFKDALKKMSTQGVDLVALTGDLVDVPEADLNDELISLIHKDYAEIKALLEQSGLDHICIPGNHDHLDTFYKVFGKQRLHEAFGYEFISFYDHVPWPEELFRQGEDLEVFDDVIAKKGPRNQIHLQHYVLHTDTEEELPLTYTTKVPSSEQEKTRLQRSLKNHAHADSEELLTKIRTSSRVKLVLSGHFHPGCQLKEVGDTSFHTSPSFSERSFSYILLNVSQESVMATTCDLQSEIASSPIESPYSRHGQWLRGGLHTHCEESSGCSSTPLETGIQMYAKQKYDFLAITDHDKITSLEKIKEQHPEMVFFEGFEHSVSNHMLFISEKAEPFFKVEDKSVALVDAQNHHLTIICHPQGPTRDYWTKEELKDYPVLPTGVEVFNGHYGAPGWRTNGSGWEYTDYWVKCLDDGLRLLAYSNDDFHDKEKDFANGWNMVLTSDRAPSTILEALRNGSCYATTGLNIKGLHEYQGRIVITFDQDVKGTFFGPGHEVLLTKRAKTFEISHQGEDYLRFEAEYNGKKCWTQAFHGKKTEKD